MANVAVSLFIISTIILELLVIDTQCEHCAGQLPQETRKIILDQVRSNLLRVLGLKEAPKPKNKAYVPIEMLREYANFRDSVRVSIPNDRDFYGKIDLDDLHPSDHNFWNEIANKYSHGIEIDMSTNDDDVSRKFFSQGDVTQVSAIQPEVEPLDIDPKLERILPPHDRLQQFTSVHMRFNLSQEMFTIPYSPKNVRGAVLKLNRERLLDCGGDKCDRQIPATDRSDGSTNTTPTRPASQPSISGSVSKTDQRPNADTRPRIPFYQRVFINFVTGFAKDGTPMTNIVQSQRIDTRHSTPISFDISDIVKRWLKNPADNRGIIIRVTNDDPEYEKLMKQASPQTNASLDSSNREEILEHVRLKRGFRSMSDDEESWIRKKPTLTLYLASDDENRRHVKRDHSTSDMNEAQADAPDPHTESTEQQAVTNTPLNSQVLVGGLSDVNQTNPIKPSAAKPSVAPPAAPVRRDSRQTDAKSQPSRPSAGRGSPSSTSQRARKAPKPSKVEKCGLRHLTINFDDVGWSNWIIAPSSYLANFCMGDCSFPLADHQNTTNHAIIQAIFHSVGRNIPRTCCAPTKLGRMAILYQLDNSVQMKYYDDMIVESCGCL